jgi:hypothetical protein
MASQPTRLKDGCLLALQYFGIFRYPLKIEEILVFNPVKATMKETRSALDQLMAEGTIYQRGPFFLPVKDEEWVPERIIANENACYLLEKSGKYVSIIASFPFVRGIAISGSLSKFCASTQPDIDYFIITEADKLWITRTLLHLFKKLTFVTGHQHYFCMNYFVDTNALTITHPNLYSAIEAATLLPVYHATVIDQFYNENDWIDQYLPNHPGPVNLTYLRKNKKQPVKKAIEGIAGIFFPGKVNYFLMKLTDRKWRSKWKRAGYPEVDYDRAFMTSIHISKNHPVDYEKKVLASIAEYQMQGRQGN